VLVALLVVVGAVAAAWLTLRRRADLAAFSRTRARTFAALSRNASDAVTVIDADGIVETQAGATETVLGRDPAAVVGMAFCDLVHPDDRDRFATLLERGLIEWRVAHPDGTCLDVETRATDLRRDPNVRGLVLTTHDISGRKALEQTLRHRASHDPLTALPNRALFHERLEAALDPAAADGIAVLYVDLDGFKGVNDRLGHAAGDEVLVAAAERLRGCVRAEDTVARLGGDEFALLLGVGPEHPDPADVAERVLAAFTRPVATGAGEVVMAPSIGIARPDERRTGVDDVVRAADAAMYLAKRAGGARYAEAGPAGSALVGAA
jgi:diguanylate cyclase (GGDEF)-like protein/PAS domain S-box-containing protein